MKNNLLKITVWFDPGLLGAQRRAGETTGNALNRLATEGLQLVIQGALLAGDDDGRAKKGEITPLKKAFYVAIDSQHKISLRQVQGFFTCEALQHKKHPKLTRWYPLPTLARRLALTAIQHNRES